MFTLNIVCIVGLASAVICTSMDHENDNLYIRQAEQVGNSTSREGAEGVITHYGKECWNRGCTEGTCAWCEAGVCCRKNWRQGEGCSGENGCDGFHCCVWSDYYVGRCEGTMGSEFYQKLAYPSEEAYRAVMRAYDNVRPKSDKDLLKKGLDEVNKLVQEYTGKSTNSIVIVDTRKRWHVRHSADYDCVVANGWTHFIFYDDNQKVSNARQKRANFLTNASHSGTEIGHRQKRYDPIYCYGSSTPSQATYKIVSSELLYASEYWYTGQWDRALGRIVKSLTAAGKNVHAVITLADTHTTTFRDYYYCYLYSTSECAYNGYDTLILYK